MTTSIDSISCNSLSSEEFFIKYVNERKPCHFKDQFKDWGLDKWTNEYLKSQCNSEVKIEYRNSLSERFGQGNEIQMPFKKFLEEIENGSELYYMTTQKLNYSEEGQASILSPPMSCLKEDFPINPPLMGNLILQNINLWMGASTTAVTSGLHHDYHDNLYIVLRGTKRITLFAPSEHSNMYTVGKLVKLHANGRINYEGKLTRADGSHESSERALNASLELEKAILDLEQNEDKSDNESDIENALENLLDAQIACDDDFSDDTSDINEEEEEEEEDDIPLDLSIPHHVLTVNTKKRCCDYDCSDSVSDMEIKKKHRELASMNEPEYSLTTKETTPPNFSLVDTSLSPEELMVQFPLFLEARKRGAEMVVTLHAGEMLYLPAGWFHEVISVGSPPLGHMAMNYWFHPPDNNLYVDPYTCNFWKTDWDIRVKSGVI